MSEMIATGGVASHEGKRGKRVDGEFYPVYGKYGEVIGYKYNHKKCYYCGSENVRIMENDYKICSECNTVIDLVHTPRQAERLAESNRSRDARMRSYKYFIMHNISGESWQHP